MNEALQKIFPLLKKTFKRFCTVVANNDQYLLSVSVPVGPEAVLCFINFSAGYLRQQRQYVRARGKIKTQNLREVQLHLTLKAMVS